MFSFHWAKNDNFLFIFLKTFVTHQQQIARPPVRVPVKLKVVVLCPRPVATVGRQSEVPVGQPPPGVQGGGQLPGCRLHRLRHRGSESASQ